MQLIGLGQDQGAHGGRIPNVRCSPAAILSAVQMKHLAMHEDDAMATICTRVRLPMSMPSAGRHSPSPPLAKAGRQSLCGGGGGSTEAVSARMCEDKLNDLNKWYKRVVDLLGRGKACKVVENHALLDAMDELTQKSKDEACKLLSSKHLFFREMCGKHNSGAATTAAGIEASACFHHPSPASMTAASSAARQAAAAAPSLGMKDSSAGPEDDEDDNEVVPRSNNVDDEDDDDDEVGLGMKSRRIYDGGGNDAPS
ncbi:hypothetical protein OsI_12570 [Oryza sativa Indica Group]|uniref:Uncharacterized protein n=2 Tax=Oryza TaxID=4527 RepID=B8AM68_ORYSI|nr:hypothetical protein OsI_12570 [Oryza sativa Indica Group]